ncbi:MAG: DUF4242 domain-containing protein [Candidatus Nitrosocosmicus sp.]|nr:DUF4242 domain-containing protein [Candidatus Nitrosocosmicus sp.]
MPKFLDAHDMGHFNEDKLKQAQDLPKDEFGVTHENILYNKVENKLFCLLDAPSKEAVNKHHHKIGLRCDWITEVKTTADN